MDEDAAAAVLRMTTAAELLPAGGVGWQWWDVLGAGLACGALVAVVGALLVFRLLARVLKPKDHHNTKPKHVAVAHGTTTTNKSSSSASSSSSSSSATSATSSSPRASPRAADATSSSAASGASGTVAVVPASGEMVLASAARPVAVTVATATGAAAAEVEADEQDVLAAVLSGSPIVTAADVDDFSSGGSASAALAASAVVVTSTRRRSYNSKLPPLPPPLSATTSANAADDAAPAAVSVSATDLISSAVASDDSASEAASGRSLPTLPLALEGSIGSLAMAAAVTTSGNIEKQKKKEKKDKDKKERKEKEKNDKRDKKEKKDKEKKSNKKLPLLPPPLPVPVQTSSSSSSLLSPAAAWTSPSPVLSARGRKKSGQLADQPEFLLDLVVHSAAELAAANRNGLSDPRVRVSGCGQKFKTRYIANTLNPEWQQTFSFTKIQDPEQDRILFDVRDHENIGKSKPLGTAVLELKQLRLGEETPVCLPLLGLAKNDRMQIPATGRLYLTATLRSKEETKKRPEEHKRNDSGPLTRSLDSFTAVPTRNEEQQTKPAIVPGPPSLGEHKKSLSPPVTPRSGSSADGVDLSDLDDGLDTAVAEEEASGVSKEGIMHQEGTLQIRTLKVWKERWFSLADDGHLVYWKNEKKKKVLGVIDFRGCEVRLRIATHKSVEKEKKMASGKANGKKLRFAFEIVHPANKPIFLRETATGTVLKSYKAHGRTHRCILRAKSKLAMDDWFYAINYSAHSLQTSEGLFSIPASAKMVPVPYLSILIARHFEDMRTSSIMRHVLMKKLGGKLSTMRRPPALGPLVLEDFDLGQSMKDIFKGMRACTTDIPNEMLGEIDVNYANGINLRISTFLTKGIVQIPLVVAVNLHLLAGKLKVYCPADVSSKWWACFNRLPELNVGITLYIDGRKLPVSSLPKLRHWVFHAIQNLVRDRLVWPARLKFRFPFPGQRIDMEIMYAVVRPPTAPVAVLPVVNEVVARRYLATRYFEEIINRRQLHLIEELFTADCVVHGGLEANGEAAHGPLHGVEGVYAHVSALLTAFPRVRFICESVSVEGQYHAIVRWKARATNDGPFLGHTPLGDEVILHGVTVNVIRYGNQRIAVQHHYFDGHAVADLLSASSRAANLCLQQSA